MLKEKIIWGGDTLSTMSAPQRHVNGGSLKDSLHQVDDKSQEAIDEEFPFSRGETSANTHTQESIQTTLKESLGMRTLRSLNGVMHTINKADIPDEVVAKADGDINSIHGYVKDNKVYIVADNIPQEWNKNQVRGLVMHEVGVHLRKAGTDKKGFDAILDYMQKLKESDPRVKEAYESVPKETDALHVNEEALAYLVQNNPNISVVRRVIAWVKSALLKMGMNPQTLKINADDLAAMAFGAIRKNTE